MTSPTPPSVRLGDSIHLVNRADGQNLGAPCRLAFVIGHSGTSAARIEAQTLMGQREAAGYDAEATRAHPTGFDPATGTREIQWSWHDRAACRWGV